MVYVIIRNVSHPLCKYWENIHPSLSLQELMRQLEYAAGLATTVESPGNHVERRRANGACAWDGTKWRPVVNPPYLTGSQSEAHAPNSPSIGNLGNGEREKINERGSSNSDSLSGATGKFLESSRARVIFLLFVYVFWFPPFPSK